MLNQNSPGMASTVERLQDIPEGFLLSQEGGIFTIPEKWRDVFAVSRSGNVHYLIVSDSAFGTSQMLEIRRQMGAANLGNVQIIRATKDVVRLLYLSSNATKLFDGKSQTTVEELAQEIISEAARQKASDIHIESQGHRANIYFRVNGTRRFYREITSENAYSMGVVLYSVHADSGSKDVSWDPGQVMDASVEWETLDKHVYQLRFSSAPIFPSGGFHIVIRLLSMESKGGRLDQLGYSQEQLSMIDVMISGSSGMVILCGPTNSGKSTSLQALLNRIYERRGDSIKMITVEDPVEYVIPGACQISVARKRKASIDQATNSAFTNFLRGTLRQDPDVVMVGEIRDHDSASVVKDLVLAGRKLMTTLHTYSALWSYVRLREIGVPWELLTMPGFVAGIVYQRLVPVLCNTCSIPLSNGGAERLPKDVLHRLQQVIDFASGRVRVRGDGCAECLHTGVISQTVCAEFVLPDRVLLRHLSNNDFIEAERYWRKAGLGALGHGVTALSHGIQKMQQGLFCPVDVEERLGLLTADLVMEDNIISASELNLLAGKR